jgi:hypothetical protein
MILMKFDDWIMIGLLLSAVVFITRAIFLFFKENKKQKGSWIPVLTNLDMYNFYLGECVVIKGKKFLITKKDYTNKKLYIEPMN